MLPCSSVSVSVSNFTTAVLHDIHLCIPVFFTPDKPRFPEPCCRAQSPTARLKNSATGDNSHPVKHPDTTRSKLGLSSYLTYTGPKNASYTAKLSNRSLLPPLVRHSQSLILISYFPFACNSSRHPICDHYKAEVLSLDLPHTPICQSALLLSILLVFQTTPIFRLQLPERSVKFCLVRMSPNHPI